MSSILLKEHLEKSKNIYRKIHKKQSDYVPIDWQKEVKTGFRYDSKLWYKDNLNLGSAHPGVDLKVARELSRGHHWLQMAIIAQQNEKYKERLILEYRSQVLDFISSNPPRMGVHWLTSMDVAFRAANLLWSYDIMIQLDSEGRYIDGDFKQIFSDNLFEHGKHIFENLEDRGGITNNHYYANVCGLFIIAAYLPQTTEVKQWLKFSFAEFIVETDKQFFPDGGNFEGSTSYHALGTEMALMCISHILGLSKKKKALLIGVKSKNPLLSYLKFVNSENEECELLPDWLLARVFDSVRILELLTKNNGNLTQIGDNDSSRFF